jgi:predicted O-methyltransferase YrrM
LVQDVLDAIERTMAGVSSAQESAWIRQIDNLRRSLLHSNKEVSVEDFGALPDVIGVRRVADICRNSAIARPWGLLLFHFVRSLQPRVCIELGTSLGISASYLGAACMLNGRGSVMTLEGSGALAAVAGENLRTLGLSTVSVVPGRFAETLEDVLTRSGPVDLAFVDGHHDGEATIGYFRILKRHLAPSAVLLFDDILWSAGMRKAWRMICGDTVVAASADFARMGILITSNEAGERNGIAIRPSPGGSHVGYHR